MPHHGDPELFWHGELISLCKHCHDGEAQQIERKGYGNDIDASGWPTHNATEPYTATNGTRLDSLAANTSWPMQTNRESEQR